MAAPYGRSTMTRSSHRVSGSSQEYGIEDARISTIGDRYYMTVCCVSAARHSTMLHESYNGLDWQNLGIVLDHQNKDMLLFEGKIGNAYRAADPADRENVILQALPNPNGIPAPRSISPPLPTCCIGGLLASLFCVRVSHRPPT